MTKRNADFGENLIELGAVGFLGYMAGKGKYQGWDHVISKHKQNLEWLSWNKVVPPFQFFLINKNARTVYREAVGCYLIGLPNASIPMTIRVFEMALKEKYKQEESEHKDLKLHQLIDLAEKYLGNNKEIAHGFRVLRNLIHSETLVDESKASDALRYVTEFINLLYPFNDIWITTGCNSCGFKGKMLVKKESAYIGYNQRLQCSSCSKIYDQVISHISEPTQI